MKKILLIAVVVCAGFLAARHFAGGDGESFVTASFSPHENLKSVLRAKGSVDTFKSGAVRAPDSRFSRQIVWLKEEGSEVSKGELVAKFDASDIALYLEELAVRTQNLIEDEAAFNLAWDTAIEKLENSISMQIEAVALQELDVDQKKYHATLVRKMSEIGANNQRNYLEAMKAQRNRMAQQRKLAESYQKAKFDRHEKNVKKTEELIALYDVRAPFDSVVCYPQIYIAGIMKKAEQGDSLVQMQEFARLPDFSSKCLVLRLRERGVKSMRVGQKVEFEAGAIAGKKFSGVVRSFSATPTDDISGEESRRYFEVNVTPDESPALELLLPGMTVSAGVVLKELENAYAIPADYVVNEDGKMFLDVLSKDGAPRRELVEPKYSDDDFVYIDSARFGSQTITLAHRQK